MHKLNPFKAMKFRLLEESSLKLLFSASNTPEI